MVTKQHGTHVKGALKLDYVPLFRPTSIGPLKIKNRIGMAPINNTSQMDLQTGVINQRCIDYYFRRAQGGVGLIVSGVFKVENKIEVCMDVRTGALKWPLISSSCVAMLDDLAKSVQALGTKLVVQLSAGPGRVTRPDVIESGVQPVSASANPCFFSPGTICRPLETSEVEQIVEAFGDAVDLLRQAGVDGIEVHGHEGYLLDQFSTALWNRRGDKYGGTLERRLTLAREILDIAKKRGGEDFPVIYRLGVKHFIYGDSSSERTAARTELGRDIEEAIQMARLLENMGYDALDLDVGAYESAYMAHPPQYLPPAFSLDLIAQVKGAVAIPVLAAGKLGDPEVAVDAVLKGKTDIVLLGRSLLADPDWPLKLKKGKVRDIRPCIGCDEACRPKPILKPISCSVNPECDREGSAGLLVARDPKHVFIVGGGVAGMEAARVATLRTHKVVLFEKTDRLGGHLIEASAPEFKGAVKRLLDWYLHAVKLLPIDVRLNQSVSKRTLEDGKPDVVVIATGSSPAALSIQGADASTVHSCTDVLRGKVQTGRRVVVIGGGSEGCETALWLAREGKQVTIIEQLPDVLEGIWWTHRSLLKDLLVKENVKLVTGRAVRNVSDIGEAVGGASPLQMPFDTVCVATGMKPNDELQDSLAGGPFEYYVVGDAVQPRKIHHAIWDGYMVGRAI